MFDQFRHAEQMSSLSIAEHKSRDLVEFTLKVTSTGSFD